MKYIYLFVCFFCTTLQAQTLEGAFSFQGEEIATSNILLTAIGGQPFEGTTVEAPLSYGFIEVVSTANEYTNVSALTLEKDQVSVKVLKSHDKWFGVTYKEDKDLVVREVKALIEKGLYPEN